MKLPRSLKLFSQKNTSRNTPPAVQDSLDVDNSAKLASDKYKLLPVNDIAINEEGTPYQFSATSTDPFFVVDRNPAEIITPGWYCIFMHINNAGGHQVAKLYADMGRGCSEDDAYRLPYRSGQPMMQIIHFPEPVHSLRFDPQEVEGGFDLMGFQLSSVDEGSATEVMLKTLSSSPKYLLSSDTELRDSITADAAALAAPFSSVTYQKYLKEVSPAAIHGISTEMYHEWIENVEKAQLHSDEQIEGNLNYWKIKPKVSILVPTYDTEEKYLRACIDSVIAQSYPVWELCLADDCSPSSHVKAILEEYQAFDDRIKVIFREENGHISKATNSALSIATGEYIALLDHDDMLVKDALYHMVERINAEPSTKILYSDEDWVDARGGRIRPHFKSDWNPDLFYSHNYITHFCVYERNLIDSVDGLRVGVEGSQDYDLLLRCISVIDHNDIAHVSRVLYHWRAIEGSTALSAGEKSYSDDAGLKALEDHFEANYPGLASVALSELPNMYKVDWRIPDVAPLVSLIMPTRDQKDVTETAVRSILDLSTYTTFELLIIDNGSEKQETLDFFDAIQKEDGRVKVLRYDQPFNYPAINNFGVEHAKGEIIGLINNDVEVITKDWLTEMVSHAVRPDIGCVGAKLYYENDALQHGGVIVGIGGVAGHAHKGYPRHESGYVGRMLMRQNLSAVTAACLLVKRSLYDEVGGLDAANLAVAFNDVDFCLKIHEAGYRNLWTPFAELYHYESISRGYEDTPEKVERFERETDYMKTQWKDFLSKGDPYYNGNLTLNREDFSLDIK